MRKIKFILPILALSAIVAFAFGNIMLSTKSIEKVKNNSKETLADTYFVFNGTSKAQYTDSTKWTMHTTNPNPSCPGDSIACLVKSPNLLTRSELVTFIQNNGGEISGQATIENEKAVE